MSHIHIAANISSFTQNTQVFATVLTHDYSIPTYYTNIVNYMLTDKGNANGIVVQMKRTGSGTVEYNHTGEGVLEFEADSFVYRDDLTSTSLIRIDSSTSYFIYIMVIDGVNKNSIELKKININPT